MSEEEEREKDRPENKEPERGNDPAPECGQQRQGKGAQTKGNGAISADSDPAGLEPTEKEPNWSSQSTPNGAERQYLEGARDGESRCCGRGVGQYAHHHPTTETQDQEACDEASQKCATKAGCVRRHSTGVPEAQPSNVLAMSCKARLVMLALSYRPGCALAAANAG